MKKVISPFIVLALTMSLCACSAKVETPDWQEQFDLGIRYLSEGNYEEAILTFTAAIEIDPMKAETYEKLADAYLALGDADAALQALRDGLAATDDPHLQAQIDELTALEPAESHRLDPLISDLKFEEVTFLGHSIQNLDIWTMKTIMEENGLSVDEQDNEDHWWIGDIMSSGISALQYKDESYVCLWGFKDYVNHKGTVGVREICMNDTLETVLTKLGVSNAREAVTFIEEIAAGTYENSEDIFSMLDKEITGSFDLSGAWTAAILDNGFYRMSEMPLSLCIHWPDSQDNKYYVIHMRFERESDSRFVGHLIDYEMDVYVSG